MNLEQKVEWFLKSESAKKEAKKISIQTSEVSANVWEVKVKEGDEVIGGETVVAVLE